MKKKFITVACAALACTSLAFGLAACGDKKSGVSALKTTDALYATYSVPDAYTTAEVVTSLEGYQSSTSTGDFYHFTKGNSVAVLNVKTGKILTFENVPDGDGVTTTKTWSVKTLNSVISGSSQAFGNTILVADLTTWTAETDSAPASTTYERFFYDANGTKFATETYTTEDFGRVYVSRVAYGGEILSTFSVYEGLTRKTFYFNKDGEQKEYDPAANMFAPTMDADDLTEVDAEIGGYWYYDNVKKSYTYYNAEFKAKVTLDLPSYAYATADIDFENGNRLIQYRVQEESNAKDYDYMLGETKYSLYTKLIDINKSKVKDLDYSVLLKHESDDSVEYMSLEEAEEYGYSVNEKVAFYVIGVQGIDETKRLDSETTQDWFAIYESGELRKVKDVTKKVDVAEAYKNSLGEFLVRSTDDRIYVVSKKGSIIKEVNINLFDEVGNYFVYYNPTTEKDELYDASFNKIEFAIGDYGFVYDDDDEVITLAGEPVLTQELNGVTTYYLYNNGEMKELAKTAENVQVRVAYMNGVGLMVAKQNIETGAYECMYYNEAGTQITTIDNQIMITRKIASYENEDGVKVSYCSYMKMVNGTPTYGVIKLS